MTDIRDETRTSTPPAKATNGIQPGVEVYDTDETPAGSTVRESGSVVTRDPYDYDPADRRDVVAPEPTTNWAGIIIGLLVVIALIALLIWLL